MRIGRITCLITAVVLAAAMSITLAGCGGSGGGSEYEWPDAEIAKVIPQPEGNITSLSFDDEEYLYATVKCDEDQYKEFIEGSKDKGFTEDQDVSQSEDYYFYTAKNKEKYELSADYMDGELSISLYAPSDLDSEKADTEEETTAAETKAEKSSDSGKVSADFKEMMDEYEEFVDEYVAFMEKYENSSDTASMMTDYAKFMGEYSEYMEKIEAVDQDELSDADLAYYLKVTSRVNEKLADASL